MWEKMMERVCSVTNRRHPEKGEIFRPKKEMRANSKINSIEERPGWLGTEIYCKALLSACLVAINLKGCKDAKQVFKI